MKKLLLLLFPLTVLAEGPIINPAETPQRILTCVKPLEYTDDTTIEIGGITEIRLYKSRDNITYEPVATLPGDNECRFTVNVNELPAGQYYYVATAVAGDESAHSNSIPFEVKRIPKPPTLNLD